ncbi:hypothetical protein SO802_027091 [Lithocarpus litseifolius]|uniref:Reverse transcriptase domain-containing protein n=1 Tax=Lithocarpus litseifolius TaxID=425828 RepID=A0AAW2C1P9_9ROSI
MKKLFRFEAMWLKEPQCEDIVQNAWNDGALAQLDFPLISCTNQCRMQLKAWNKNVFRHVGRKINELQEHLEWLEMQPASPGNIQDMRDIRIELNKWHDKEDAMWYQRSRINWFRDGDRNTSYFHAKASARLKKNQIDGMLNAQEMQSLKAPGPDGMPPLFYQYFWPTVGDVVTKTVLDFLNHGLAPPNFNETHIVLIPKVKEPKRVTDFRPISLCNMVFRITSKVIANELKKIFPSIISDTQSAFVHGRLITDNVLVAFETMHHINGRKGGRKGEMTLKLDMSKAYDRVEWLCLEKIMAKLGFGEKWRKLIMRCATTVSYSVKINGKPRAKIIQSRGIRQRDPLSPYLFLLCAEGLSALIKKSMDMGEMEGITVCKGAPRLSHLFFADDSIIFCKATIEECNALQRILGIYEQASGQQLNRIKIALFFSKNTPDDIKEEIKTRFGAQVIQQHEKYLGLPSLVGKNKRNTFNDIKDKLSKKLADFVHASMGNHPSYAWRSIMAAQQLVKQGIRWNVGNGESVRVWGDKWLPSSSTFKLVSPRLFMHADLRVNELISHEPVGWKMQVIDALFLPHEANTIKIIPLSTHLPPDKLIWAATTNGLFSVQSAYRLAMELSRSDNTGSRYDGSGLRSFWKRIWRIPVPHKIRHFTWRACREILPTKANLKRQKVVDMDVCEECNNGLENSGHLFWSCQRARQIWQCTKLRFAFEPTAISSFFDLIWHLMMIEEYDEDKVATVVTIAWSIWANRNEVRQGGIKKTGVALVKWSAQYLAEYRGVNSSPEPIPRSQDVRWSPPPRTRYKINVDGAVFKTQKSAGVGVLIRDDQGLIVAALSQKINAPLGALEVEAKAVEVALQFARDVGISDLIIEGDSFVIYNALSGHSTPPSSVASVISGALAFCVLFHRVEFSHIRRQGNKLAHLLAKHALGIVDYVA